MIKRALFLLLLFLPFLILSCNSTDILESIEIDELIPSDYTNGTYIGNYSLNLPSGYFIAYSSINTAVTISNHQIQSIKILADNKASISFLTPYINEIVIKQKVHSVDSITGATFTKVALQKSILNAFGK